jgi:hypothetical protein
LIILNFTFSRTDAQSGIPGNTISIHFYQSTLESCIHEFSNRTGLKFGYRYSLLDTIENVSLLIENEKISVALDSLLFPHNIDYIYKNGQILLKKRSGNIQLQGCIAGLADSAGIPYASLSLKNSTMGAICDFKGNYQWELSNKHKNDTVVVSSMGYNRQQIIVKDLIRCNTGCLYLEEKSIEIEPVTISKRDFRVCEMGNKGTRALGALYLDTHGQQTGLYIENKRGILGTLETISFYLDGDGNTHAPFRVRLYEVDTSLGIPVSELFKEILIVKPTGEKGWYTLDFYTYQIQFPENGLFIAMQGIFPNEYDYYSGNDDFIDIQGKTKDTLIKEEVPMSIAYGQKLGYNRRMSEDTWHYSLSHIWFQLAKQQYGLLIKASVKFPRHKMKKRKEP